MQIFTRRAIAAAMVGTMLITSVWGYNGTEQERTKKYEAYISQYDGKQVQEELVITSNNVDLKKSKDFEIKENYAGSKKIVLSEETGSVLFQFDVEQAGLYNIEVRYIAVKGKDINIQREIRVNGKIPFYDFNEYEFHRVWKDDKIISDENGNQYIPEQLEVFKFQNEVLHSGAQNDDVYKVYFEKGKNTIEFVSVKEAIGIEHIRLFHAELPMKYNEYITSKRKENGDKTGKAIIIEGENAFEKSDNTLYPVNDKTSSITSPNSIDKLLINAVGGNNWGHVKQKITWKIPVEESGFYKLNIRLKQDFAEGSNAYRRFYINGKVPFYEALTIEVPYKKGFQNLTLGKDEPMLIWLDAGDAYFTIENVYGDTYPVYEEVKGVITELNDIYRKIIMITSTTPDENRDYNLEKTIPKLIETLKASSQKLNDAKSRLEEITGVKGNNYSLIQALEVQINGYADKPYLIASSLSSFNTNISALSSAVLTQIKQPVLIDKIDLLPEKEEPAKANASFFASLIYEIKSLIMSFFNDYTMIAQNNTPKESITIWLSAGRDQSNSMKQLIDNDFSKKKGIGVNLRLVDAGALLPAVAVGSGPDVAITQDRTMPLNYGFRGAVYDLSRFEDCNEVLKQFPDAATAPFTYNGAVYGIPDTFVFYMMFYRKDILKELNLNAPKTWNALNDILPILGNRYLSLGLPNVSVPNASVVNNDIFFTLLYQRGADVYDNDLRFAKLASDDAVSVFEQWTDLYTKYSVPKELDSFTRFRTGEAPIVIAPYTFYNQLVIAAPEIEGMWDMTNVPGTLGADGTINHSVSATGTASVIFENSKNKEGAWEFIKWWTSPDAQQKYNQRLEVLMGPSARVAVSSAEALEKLPWTRTEYNKLMEQMQYAKGVPEVPGGYMTQRYINTAVLLSINNSSSPRSTITSYNRMINDEIRIKREEFGLDR